MHLLMLECRLRMIKFSLSDSEVSSCIIYRIFWVWSTSRTFYQWKIQCKSWVVYFLYCWLAVSHVVLNKFKADVAGKKLNRKFPTRARQQKLRCREPSRILKKVLTRVFRKSRKWRRLVRRAISKNFPKVITHSLLCTFHCSSQCQE